MGFLGWCIVIIPVSLVVGMAVHSRKYVRGVADYLAAGRVAGRYVISVSGIESALGIITLVAAVEVNYQTGFAMGFWGNVLIPLSTVIALTGYCSFRFRETKALSFGQFLEIRYNRKFRIFAATLRTFSEMLTNMIGPAVAARFFIYLLGIPHIIDLGCIEVPSFALIMILSITLALVIIWSGGMIGLIISDCIQGLMSYPIFVIFTVFVLTHFSWSTEIVPVMLDRVPGENFLNPYDIQSLRDFNLFALIVTIFNHTLNKASWAGGGSDRSGRTPHEQKMAGILGSWRAGFSYIMCILIGIAIITTMNHSHFSGQARKIRIELSGRIAEEVVQNDALKNKLAMRINLLPEQQHRIGVDQPLSRNNNLDTTYLNTAKDVFNENGNSENGNGNAKFQEYRTLFYQMMLPVTLRNILPPFMLGLFCLLMVMLMLSTDDSRMFSSALTIMQDVIMPFRKTPLSPIQHIWWIRMCSLFVGITFFFGSLLLSQLDYILLFCVIMSSIWLGGAGPVMVFGLYSRFGTTAGAFASLITGSCLSIGGVMLQRNWAGIIYPWLERVNLVESIGDFLSFVSKPFNPYIVWEMNPVKFPINSQEFFFMAMISSVAAYIIASLISYRSPFNLERMLHRGKYSIDGEKHIQSLWSWKSLYSKLIGITPDYTRGDKIIAWTTFSYTIVYQFFFAFCGVVIFNFFAPWSSEGWSNYFLLTTLIIPGAVATISTIWFTVGGVIDLRRLFVDLAARKDDPLDDGRVEGHMSLADKAKLEALDNVDDKGNKLK